MEAQTLARERDAAYRQTDQLRDKVRALESDLQKQISEADRRLSDAHRSLSDAEDRLRKQTADNIDLKTKIAQSGAKCDAVVSASATEVRHQQSRQVSYGGGVYLLQLNTVSLTVNRYIYLILM